MYRIILLKDAQKYLSKMPMRDRIAVNYALTILSEGEWTNLDISHLEGVKSNSAYRVRVGKYRIIFELFEAQCIVHVVKVGPRGDVYK